MKALRYALLMVVLLGLSGCMIVPWGWGHGGGGHGGDRGGGERHESHR